MARLTADQWSEARAMREAGASLREVAVKAGVSHQAVTKRAKAEQWADGADVAAAVRKQVAAKVAGVVAADTIKKRVAAIDAEADRAVEVLNRHREEPRAIRERLYAGLKAHREAASKESKQLAFEDLKAAKIASECLLNIHRAERIAWGFDDAATAVNAVVKWEGSE